MPDIFISYSRKDAQQADDLAERLRQRGIDVWIDKSGIEAAKSWSKEIVRAIDGCKAFVVLISSNSQASENVSREVGIASEGKKPMLPIALEDIKLSDELRYHLSGIQRVAYTQFDAIAQALEQFGVARVLTRDPARVETSATPQDDRKSLMILPFEDLSPTGDNGWFADGIASELITALSNVKSLRVADQQATKDYKRYTGTLPKYAAEMQIRYFVQGDVRKFGDSIKITSRLLDIETGDHLWQDSMKGTMDDIFDIQEKVAVKVVEGLQIHLASDEKQRLAERGTENAEALELFLRAYDFYLKYTAESIRLAISQLTEAIELDPNYAEALRFKGFLLAKVYRTYERDSHHLAIAEQLIQQALVLRPNLWGAYGALSSVYQQQGAFEKAEEAATQFVHLAPNDYYSHYSLANYYLEAGKYREAIVENERSIELNPQYIYTYWNVALAARAARDTEKVLYWARTALPLYERRLRLAPDDETARAYYANLLELAGDPIRAREEVLSLLARKDLDGNTLFNIGSLLFRLGDVQNGVQIFRRALRSGLAVEYISNDLDEFRDIPEVDEFVKELEAKKHNA